MSFKFEPHDPRYEDRCQAAVELLRMWRNMVDEGPGVPRYVVLPGSALNTMVEWTDSFLAYPDIPKFGTKT